MSLTENIKKIADDEHTGYIAMFDLGYEKDVHYMCNVKDDGTQVWYADGKLEDPCYDKIIHGNTKQEWRLNTKLHRTDGPAVTYKDGSQGWYVNGKRHREDGPAIIRADGTTKQWFLNDKPVNPKDMAELLKDERYQV